MTLTEELMQAALMAPEERKAAAIRVLRGDPSTGSGQERPETERYLTLKECARRLGVSACSLWRWGVPGHELGGRRNEGRGSRAGSSDPVLAFPKLAWLLAAAPALRQKDLMDFPDEPQGQGKTPAKSREAMVQCRDVVRDFLDII